MNSGENILAKADPRLLALLERIANNQEAQHIELCKALEDIRYGLGMVRQSLPR